MSDTSVVIATYTEDRWRQLTEAVDSARSQVPAPLEVVVVVDHNPSLFARAQRELENVLVVENNEHRGLSGARNTGAKVATGSIVVFLDDDARARPAWLAAIVGPFADAEVLGVGGLTLPAWAAGSPPFWFPEEYLWVVGAHYRGHRRDRGPVRSPIGANMAFRRAVIDEAGGFSWRFSTPPFDRCDETEFSIRARRLLGGEIIFEPEAVVDHSVSVDRHRWQYFVRRCLLEGRAKAELVRQVGAGSATSIERSYVTRVLPRAVGRYLLDGLRGSGSDLAKALNIFVGLAAAGSGFLWGRFGGIGRLEPLMETDSSRRVPRVERA